MFKMATETLGLPGILEVDFGATSCRLFGKAFAGNIHVTWPSCVFQDFKDNYVISKQGNEQHKFLWQGRRWPC